MMKLKKGFTLTEVLIVVVIIGISAAVVMPRYFGQTERGYVAEATAMLSAIRQAEVAYNLENAVYAPVASLDIDVTAVKFSYGVNTTTGNATATRTSSNSFNGKTIILNMDGTWDAASTHPYKPNN